MKVYTKTGDKGTTSLLGGKRVKKNIVRLETYGTVDELNAFVGLLRDSVKDANIYDQLIEVQNNLLVLGGVLASGEDFDLSRIPNIQEHNIIWLEQRIDEFEEELPPIKAFVLPGGHPVVSYCHIARTVCRRAERLAISITETSSVPLLSIQYLNRLSDYFFVLGRKLSKDLDAQEILWEPNL